MNKSTLSLIAILFTSIAIANPTYLHKFQTYTKWNEQLPTGTEPAFLAFIAENSPLTQKLREKWLYQLARAKDWKTFIQYYRDSKDTTLQCYQATALYQQNQLSQAMPLANKLWLTGHSLPMACDTLFKQILERHEISDALIAKRIELSLNEGHVSLSSHLLKQLTPARTQDALLIKAIHQNPTQIRYLHRAHLHDAFYLYGLNILISQNTRQAIELYDHAQKQQFLNERQQQIFLTNLALHKAIHNDKDTEIWFRKIKPAFYNDTLTEWMIRYALLHHRWQLIVQLSNQPNYKDNPCVQYWRARALYVTGKKDQARLIFQQLSQSRNYYGFLASTYIKQSMHFEDESVNHNVSSLQTYRPFIDEIHSLHQAKQDYTATRRLNDFMSELPKDEKSALLFWLAYQFNWYGKTIYFSNSDDLKNQLLLRFPLAYQQIIKHYARNYRIPTALIYAIIRQESAFRDDIVSGAGANGLMQLMPRTAATIAKREKIPYRNKQDLFLSSKNIQIGTAYLQDLARYFHGHPLLMVAAYNAGPRQVKYWLKNHPPKETDIWIETLPWKETRNYLKNIIAFYAVYQYRMQSKPDLSLFMKDFERG